MISKQIENPYWELVQQFPNREWAQKVGRFEPVPVLFGADGSVVQTRPALVRQYAWAIPNPEALAFVARHLAPQAIEIGAGTGYWSWCLSQLGIDIIAYDICPPHLEPNDFHSPLDAETEKPTGERAPVFYDVRYGDASKAAEYPERTLLLCWPPDCPMASEALRQYRGSKCVYIGEDEGGCTADRAFFSLLKQEWRKVDAFKLVNWAMIHDEILVYERRS